MKVRVCIENGCPLQTTDGNPRCEEHRRQKGREKRQRSYRPVAHKGYDTARWKRLRRRVLARDGHKCKECSSTATPLHVDHMDGLGMDGPRAYDPLNLRVLCRSCHGRKTALDDGGFGRPRRSDST